MTMPIMTVSIEIAPHSCLISLCLMKGHLCSVMFPGDCHIGILVICECEDLLKYTETVDFGEILNTLGTGSLFGILRKHM